jgi:hypothetical protein
MWCRVDLVLADVSEESIVAIFKGRKIRERATSVSRWVEVCRVVI